MAIKNVQQENNIRIISMFFYYNTYDSVHGVENMNEEEKGEQKDEMDGDTFT